MMMMLDAAGICPIVDHVRKADPDNPQGYFEYERVKQLPDGDYEWLPAACGKAVKVISFLLRDLPRDYAYDVIFMERRMSEILASQRKMLERRGERPGPVSDQEMASVFKKHLDEITAWLDAQENIRYIEISYNRLVDDPEGECSKLVEFFGGGLNLEAMKAKIAPQLYRQRA
jgi:hypothetical protein